METKDKIETFEPRYPTRNVGFAFLVIVLALVVATLVFLVNVFVNDHPRTDPAYGQTNWPVLIVSVLIGGLIFGLALVAIRKFLSNQPQRVILDSEKIVVQNEGEPPLQIAYNSLTSLQESKQLLAGGQYEASYKQVRLTWTDEGSLREHILSERDITNFDELLDALWERCPEQVRGPRSYDR